MEPHTIPLSSKQTPLLDQNTLRLLVVWSRVGSFELALSILP